jgi:DNA-binding winged helix-turn-helix (wHTH) protein/tetratricopeptide (TPR) repeat protein
MSATQGSVYRFGEFELEPRERRLSGGGKPIALTPKVFDTLVILVEHAGHVVSKDELMAALWPRGYVEEGVLSKHIWQIRRALGDTAKTTRFIETVPKLGYRFAGGVVAGPSPPAAPFGAIVVAPPSLPPPPEVPMLASPAEAAIAPAPVGIAPTPPPESATAVARRRSWPIRPTGAIALAAALAGACAGLALWIHGRPAPDPAPATRVQGSGRTVAFVGFTNLSQNPKDAWLAPALTEMLGTELGTAEAVRIVPHELVRDAAADAGPAREGGYAPDTLARLHRRLDADYVVSGSYLLAAAADDPPLRIDIILQDARDGAKVASVSNQAALSGLGMLVDQLGATLRGRLGVGVPSAAWLELIAHAQPPSAEVARRMGFAIDAMERYDAARARDELLEAIAQAPGYAPAYLYLSRAWSGLGYRRKALAAAEQAATRAVGLPPEQRLLIDAAVQTERYDWSAAADTWKSLIDLKPLVPEYRLASIDAQLAVGEPAGARRTLDDLRRLPGAAGDPRVELAAARIADEADDSKAEEQHAALAVQQARAREATGLIAAAQLELGNARFHLNALEPARQVLVEAIGGFRAIGNPRGEAAARRKLAQVLGNLLRSQDAREEYQRAMALAQGIGDLAGVAAVYRDLCSMLWNAGDRDGATAAARQGLQISRDTGDLRLQAWMLRAMASVEADEAASDQVMREYREVTALTERSHDPGGHVWSLATYADTLRMRGQLDEAKVFCNRALDEAAKLTDGQFLAVSTFNCALIAMDRGEIEVARGLLRQEIAKAGKSIAGNIYRANSELTLGQLDFEDAKWTSARELLRGAAAEFAANEAATGEADANAMLALCEQALGATAERDQAAARAKALRAAITSRQEVYFVDIALAQLAADPRQPGNMFAPPADSIGRLRDLAADAERRQWIAWSLEAKLAEWQALKTRGDEHNATLLGGSLQAAARARGFGRIVALMNAPRRPAAKRTAQLAEPAA